MSFYTFLLNLKLRLKQKLYCLNQCIWQDQFGCDWPLVDKWLVAFGRDLSCFSSVLQQLLYNFLTPGVIAQVQGCILNNDEDLDRWLVLLFSGDPQLHYLLPDNFVNFQNEFLEVSISCCPGVVAASHCRQYARVAHLSGADRYS